MNYPGMRREIVELFQEAQAPLLERARGCNAARLARRAQASQIEYADQVWAARIGGARVGGCSECGGERRPGNPHVIHFGKCLRTQLRAVKSAA